MQRYKIRCNDCDPKITPHENGKWVRWGDVERLRAELAERKATTPAPKPDCRTCVHYIPPLSFAGEPACEFANTESVLVCSNGDAYIPADPVRLYERGKHEN